MDQGMLTVPARGQTWGTEDGANVSSCLHSLPHVAEPTAPPVRMKEEPWVGVTVGGRWGEGLPWTQARGPLR